jgi:hypothetical protein
MATANRIAGVQEGEEEMAARIIHRLITSVKNCPVSGRRMLTLIKLFSVSNDLFFSPLYLKTTDG